MNRRFALSPRFREGINPAAGRLRHDRHRRPNPRSNVLWLTERYVLLAPLGPAFEFSTA
jgi:hypothetical protein